MKNILIIDDEPEMLQSFKKILSHKDNYELTLIDNPHTALDLVRQQKFDLIITDLKMKDVSGMDILKTALSRFPESNVIMISGYGTIETSVDAMREGAFDFLEKPFTSKKLFETIERALSRIPATTGEHSKEAEEAVSNIIYKSEQIAELIKMVRKIAPGEMSVLITGESGTGKELFARAIHTLSKRHLNPFVPVNCGALPENLFESELFGHEKGAFTGAIRTKPGLLEFANQGTFFFDEIGDLSPTMQIKLLRILEDRKIRHVGGQKEIEIDVRIIAATNSDLKKAVDEGKFREDLYYRLNGIHIHVPPLRKRPEDIMPLANYFLAEMCSRNDRPVNRFSGEAEKALLSYSWPGNVRELQNMISRAYFLCTDRVIQRGDLPIPQGRRSFFMEDEIIDLSYKEAKERILDKFEVAYLSYHLRRNNGNISKTAESCGLDRRSIHRLIKKYNIIIP